MSWVDDYVILEINSSRRISHSTSKIDLASKEDGSLKTYNSDYYLGPSYKGLISTHRVIRNEAMPSFPLENYDKKSHKIKTYPDFRQSLGDFDEVNWGENMALITKALSSSNLILGSAKERSVFWGKGIVNCEGPVSPDLYADYDVPVPHSVGGLGKPGVDTCDFVYDVPKRLEGLYDVPPNKYPDLNSGTLASEALYDVPRTREISGGGSLEHSGDGKPPSEDRNSSAGTLNPTIREDHSASLGGKAPLSRNPLSSDFDNRWEKTFKDLGLSLFTTSEEPAQEPRFSEEDQRPLPSDEESPFRRKSDSDRDVLESSDVIKEDARSMENCVARALYDNVAESPDELAFCKGDLLTVLEQNTAGLEGWWLCSLRGRQGICPGNRLRIIPGCYDTGSGLTSTLSGVHPISSGTPGLQRGHSVPQQQRTPSKKVVTPKRVGDVFTYDVPRSHTQMDYDVPPSRHQPEGKSSDVGHLSRSSSLRYDTPRPQTQMRGSLEQYDTPRRLECQYDSPSSRPLYDSPKSAAQVTDQQPHYDIPRSNESASVPPRSLIKGIRGGQPPSSVGKISGAPNQNQNAFQQEYDVPRPLSSEGEPRPSDRSSNISLMSCDSQLSTSSSASSLQASESLSLSSIGGESNRSSLESHDVYDIPPEPRRFVQAQQKPKLPPREGRDSKEDPRSTNATYDTPNSNLTWSTSGEAVYDVPPQVSRDTRSSDTFDSILNRLSSGSDSSGVDFDLLNFKELPLELNSAVETLVKYEQDALVAVDKVAAVKSSKEFDKIEDMKIAIYRLKEGVGKLVNFGRGSVGNALRAGEHKLAKRLSRLIDPIESASVLTCDSWKRLQTLPPGPSGKTFAQEQFVQVASITTSLAENIRYLSSVIQSNAHLCFKRAHVIEKPLNKKPVEDEDKTPVQERPLPDIPVQKKEVYVNETHMLLEDYDYVNLESKESVEREHKEIMESLPTELRKSYDNLIKQSHLTVDSDHTKALHKTDNENLAHIPTVNQSKTIVRLDANDRQVLNFYGVQAKLHLQNLNSAIDAFLLTVENNQPPKVFIAHSKFVILSAHKLVYIGDTIHRNVINTEVRTCVLNCTNALCDAMKNTVTAAKTAALQFPSVTAVQAMVDAFVSISHLSNNLKKAICRD